jgi:hypothetical protein
VSRRGPGWPTVLGLVLVTITFPVVNPLQLVLIPLALLLVALPPRSTGSLLLALALVVLAFIGPRGTLWNVERGWALLLGGWFIVTVLLWPGRSLTARAVAATAASVASVAVLIAVQGGWAALDETIASHYRTVAEGVTRSWPARGVDGDVLLAWTGEVPARLFPALTAIGSMAALALAWLASGRLTGSPRRVGRLSEFRFPDPLVWVLIGGLALMLLPAAEWAPRLGLNLVVFMGALYSLRGLGVMVDLVVAMVGSNVAVLVVLAVVALLLYPILVAGTVLLGVTDTWLDLRSGRRAVNDEG